MRKSTLFQKQTEFYLKGAQYEPLDANVWREFIIDFRVKMNYAQSFQLVQEIHVGDLCWRALGGGMKLSSIDEDTFRALFLQGCANIAIIPHIDSDTFFDTEKSE